jgi:hypothetical protein
MALRVDAVLKLSLAAGALLAGAGVGYYFGIFLPAQAIHETLDAGTERQVQAADNTAALERARAAELRRREAERQRYEVCLSTAQGTYQSRWSAACRAQHTRQQAAFEDCADDFFSSRESCARKFPVEPEHGCALPLALSNRLAADRDAARTQCLSEMQGLGEMQGGAAPMETWDPE